jgi:hypothetical protein
LSKAVIVFPGRYGLQREDLSPLLRADGDAVGDSVPVDLAQGICLQSVQIEVTVLDILLQHPLFHQIPAQAGADSVQQRLKFRPAGCLAWAEDLTGPIAMDKIHPYFLYLLVAKTLTLMAENLCEIFNNIYYIKIIFPFKQIRGGSNRLYSFHYSLSEVIFY